MAEELKFDCDLPSPTGSQQTLPPYLETWNRDVVEKNFSKRWDRRLRSNCAATVRTVVSTTTFAFNATRRFTYNRMLCKISWPQICAFLLLLVFGAAPLIALGLLTRESDYWYRGAFAGVFRDKVLGCGNTFGVPKNSTVSGFEKVFVLDQKFGKFSFSQVKIVDVAWDILVGRGVQLLAWWIGYNVFSDALLRAIERHPASFQIFQRIALEGPSLLSLWTLAKELWCAKSKRTKALFFYIWMSTVYIICIPMFLGAMTGYDSTNIAWMNLDDTNNIVPASALVFSGAVIGTWDSPFEKPLCIDLRSYDKAKSAYYRLRVNCKTCQVKNGSLVDVKQWARMRYYGDVDYENGCKFNYHGNNETYNFKGFPLEPGDGIFRADNTYSCASTYNMTFNNKTYDTLDLNLTYGYCFEKKAYDSAQLTDKSSCLPDTADPSYQWGFSTMLSGLFIMFHFSWCVTMWIVWQDSQFNSALVREGYQMTPLRAAFAMAKAAKRKTGMGEKALVRANTKDLEKEMYGGRKREGTHLDYGIFAEGDVEHGQVHRIRRRPLPSKIAPGLSETALR